MTQVHISRHDHTVTVNHDGGDLAYVIEKAQKLWDDTKPTTSTAGPAFGFQAERTYSGGGYADMRHGEQPAVTAEMGA